MVKTIVHSLRFTLTGFSDDGHGSKNVTIKVNYLFSNFYRVYSNSHQRQPRRQRELPKNNNNSALIRKTTILHVEHTSSRLHDHKKKFSYAFFMKDVNTTTKWEFFLLFLNSKRTFDLLRVDIVVHLVSLNSHCLTDKHQTDGSPCSAPLHFKTQSNLLSTSERNVKRSQTKP